MKIDFDTIISNIITFVTDKANSDVIKIAAIAAGVAIGVFYLLYRLCRRRQNQLPHHSPPQVLLAPPKPQLATTTQTKTAPPPQTPGQATPKKLVLPAAAQPSASTPPQTKPQGKATPAKFVTTPYPKESTPIKVEDVLSGTQPFEHASRAILATHSTRRKPNTTKIVFSPVRT